MVKLKNKKFIKHVGIGLVFLKKGIIINTFGKMGIKTTFYDSNGQTIETRSYESGMLNGKVISYYEDGQIEEEFNYVDDNFDGKQIVYYPDVLQIRGEYK